MAYVKENFVQFTLFDDDREVNEDVVGVAKYLYLYYLGLI